MKWFTNARKRLRGVALFTVALSALLVLASVAPPTALAAINDQVPEHEKTIVDNGDGTYDLSLTVKGAVEASTTSTKADVVVVLDTSSSMNGTLRQVAIEQLDKTKTYFGKVGNPGFERLVEVYWGKPYGERKEAWCYKKNYYEYNYIDDCKHYGNDPTFYEATWIELAKEALGTLSDQLIENENSDVQVSLVTYSDEAQADDVVYKGGDSDKFKAAVDQLTANGGTNWEDALATANKKLTEDGRDGAKKYIVFVSDGLPTYRNSANGFVQGDPWEDSYNHYYYDKVYGKDDRWTSSTGKYGTGNSDKLGRNYGSALDEATKIDSSVQMLLVNVSTDPTEMKKFASDINGTYYEGNNEVDGYDEGTLKNAFAKIANLVTNTASYENVKITDQLSDYVDFVDASGIRYEKVENGVAAEWSNAPEATVSGKTVAWDLSGEGSLEDGVTYKMTFTVKANQNAYDAAVAVGAETELPSNNPDGTKLSYDAVAKKNNEEVDRYSGTAGYEEPTIKVPVDTVTVTKAWENTGDAQLPASVTVQLKKNGQNYGAPLELTAADNWTKTVTVPAGVGQLTWSVVESAVDDYVTTYSDAVIGSGTLTVTNTHKTWPVTCEGETAIKGTKTLTGHDMTSAFNFKLEAQQDYGDKVSIAQGADTASVSGAKDGEAKSFSFGAVTFYEAGAYKFNVTETGTAPAGYTYDTHSSVVTVDVVEKDGKLVATTSYADGDSCVFNNTYTEPKKEEKKKEKKEETKKGTKKEATPKTGDALLASEAIAAIAGTGVFGVLASRIRRKK